MSSSSSRFAWAVRGAWGADDRSAPVVPSARERKDDLLHHGVPIVRDRVSATARKRHASADAAARKPLKGSSSAGGGGRSSRDSRDAAKDALVGIDREYLWRLLRATNENSRHHQDASTMGRNASGLGGGGGGGAITAADLERALEEIQAEEREADRHSALAALRAAADELLRSPERTRLKGVARAMNHSADDRDSFAERGGTAVAEAPGTPDRRTRGVNSASKPLQVDPSPNTRRYGGHYDGGAGARVLRNGTSTYGAPPTRVASAPSGPRRLTPDASVVDADETSAVMGLTGAHPGDTGSSSGGRNETPSAAMFQHFGSRRPSQQQQQQQRRPSDSAYNHTDPMARMAATDDAASTADSAPLPMATSSAVPMAELTARARQLWNELDTPAAVRAEMEAGVLSEDTPWNRHELNVYFLRLSKEKEVLAIACKAVSTREAAIRDVAEVSRRYTNFAGYISAASSHASGGGRLPMSELQAGLTKRNAKNYSSLSSIHKEMVAKLNSYREATLDALDAVRAWMAVTERRDFRWRGRLYLVAVLHDLYQSAFRGQPAAYLLQLDTRYNPLAMTTDPHTVIPARVLGGAAVRGSVHVRGIGTLTSASPTSHGVLGTQLLALDVTSSRSRCEFAMQWLRDWLGERLFARRQAAIRSRGIRTKFIFVQKFHHIVAKAGRGFLLRRTIGQSRRLSAEATIARVAAAAREREHLRRVRVAAIAGQRIVRGFLDRCRVWYRQRAASTIQRWTRQTLGARRGRAERRVHRIALLQRAGRAYLLRLQLLRFAVVLRKGTANARRALAVEEQQARPSIEQEALVAFEGIQRLAFTSDAVTALSALQIESFLQQETTVRLVVAHDAMEALRQVGEHRVEFSQQALATKALTHSVEQHETHARWCVSNCEAVARFIHVDAPCEQLTVHAQEARLRSSIEGDAASQLTRMAAAGNFDAATKFLADEERASRTRIAVEALLQHHHLTRGLLIGRAVYRRTAIALGEIVRGEELNRRRLLRNVAHRMLSIRNEYNTWRHHMGDLASLESEEALLRQSIEATFLAELQGLGAQVLAVRKQRTMELYDRFLSATLGLCVLRSNVRRLRGHGAEAKRNRRWWRPGAPPLHPDAKHNPSGGALAPASHVADSAAESGDVASEYAAPARVGSPSQNPSPSATAPVAAEESSATNSASSSTTSSASSSSSSASSSSSSPSRTSASTTTDPTTTTTESTVAPQTVAPVQLQPAPQMKAVVAAPAAAASPPSPQPAAKQQAVAHDQPAAKTSPRPTFAQSFAQQPLFVQRSLMLPILRLQRVGRGAAVRTGGALPLLYSEACARRDVTELWAVTRIEGIERIARERLVASHREQVTEVATLHRVAVKLAERAAVKRRDAQFRTAAVGITIRPWLVKQLAAATRSARQRREAAQTALAQLQSDEAANRQVIADEESHGWVTMKTHMSSWSDMAAATLRLQRVGRRYLLVKAAIRGRNRIVADGLVEHSMNRAVFDHGAMGIAAMLPNPSGGATCWWTQAHLAHVALNSRARREHTAASRRQERSQLAGTGDPTRPSERLAALASAIIRTQIKRSFVRDAAARILQRSMRRHAAVSRLRGTRRARAEAVIGSFVVRTVLKRRLVRAREAYELRLARRRMEEAATTIARTWRERFVRRHARGASRPDMSVKEAATHHLQRVMRAALGRRAARRLVEQHKEALRLRRHDEAALVIQRRVGRFLRARHCARVAAGRKSLEAQRQQWATQVIGYLFMRLVTRLRTQRQRAARARETQQRDAVTRIALAWQQKTARQRDLFARRGLPTGGSEQAQLERSVILIQREWKRSRGSKKLRRLLELHRQELEARQEREAGVAILRCWRRRKALRAEAAMHNAEDKRAFDTLQTSAREGEEARNEPPPPMATNTRAESPPRRFVAATSADAPSPEARVVVSSPPVSAPSYVASVQSGLDDADLLFAVDPSDVKAPVMQRRPSPPVADRRTPVVSQPNVAPQQDAPPHPSVVPGFTDDADLLIAPPPPNDHDDAPARGPATHGDQGALADFFGGQPMVMASSGLEPPPRTLIGSRATDGSRDASATSPPTRNGKSDVLHGPRLRPSSVAAVSESPRAVPTAATSKIAGHALPTAPAAVLVHTSPPAPGSARRAVHAAKSGRSATDDRGQAPEVYAAPTRQSPPRPSSSAAALHTSPSVAQRRQAPDTTGSSFVTAGGATQRPPARVEAQFDLWAAEAEALLSRTQRYARGADRSAPTVPQPSGVKESPQVNRVVSPAELRDGFASPVRVPGVVVEPPSSPRPVHQRQLVAAAGLRASSTTLHPHRRAQQVSWLNSYGRTTPSASPSRALGGGHF